MVTTGLIEGEMNLHQSGLADAAFEEGLYSTGIATLGRLRSPKNAPSPYHIDQLLYIALYPPSLGKENNVPETPASPSKDKRLKELFAFSSEDVVAAQNLLFSFAITNTPEKILRALPSYSTETRKPLRDVDDLDSLFAKEAHQTFTTRCKNCWSILGEGFVPRVMQRAQQRGKDEILYQRDTDELDVELSPLSYNALPIFDWLLTLFERDEMQTEEQQLPRHSPLFLSSIPPSPNGKGVRWESDGPVGVLFHTLQFDERGKALGARLLSLLINLASTTHTDFASFVTTIFTRLSTDTVEVFMDMLSRMPPSLPVLRVRISILQKLLGSKSSQAPTSARPKPQARARPRPVRRVATNAEEPKQNEESAAQIAPTATSIASNPLLPSFTEISRAMEASSHCFPDANLSPSQLQSELLLGYGQYQQQIPLESRDKDWLAFLGDGIWAPFLDSLLDYREVLNGFLTIWKESL
ncbi:hypothetical protein D9758_001890 [Tetrapyrgos nigripes]|uniref:Uncharacterized protein n=1 Tax=Tetrapyrgos nigripes TaxID=182062 RepID=A0A8H5LV52_9AGAR|nr:hypothetical protein D9758_001890 [Tetrapyrgos nigripes]